MKNKLLIQYEKLEFDTGYAYILGLSKDHIKAIALELMKLEYNKIKTLVFSDGKSTVAEIVKKEKAVLSIDGSQLTLTDNDLSLIMSFLLDATEEYLSYDHIDLELSEGNKTFDICIKVNQ